MQNYQRNFLTPEQQEKLETCFRHWKQVQSSTGSADRHRAGSHLSRLYQSHGLNPPSTVWCGSPMSLALTRAFLDTLASRPSRPGPRLIMGDSIKKRVRNEVLDEAEDLLMRCVDDSGLETLLSFELDGWTAQARVRMGTPGTGGIVRQEEILPAGTPTMDSRAIEAMQATRDELQRLNEQFSAKFSDIAHRRTFRLDPEVRPLTLPGTPHDLLIPLVDLNRLNLGLQVNLAEIDPVMATIILALSWSLKRGLISDEMITEALAATERILQHEIGEADRQMLRDYCRHCNMGSFLHNIKSAVPECCFGQRDARLLAIHDFAARHLQVPYDLKTALFIDLSRHTGGFCPHENACLLFDRYTFLRLDENGRPHCESGPAISYPDGWEIHAWHGVFVERHVIMEPASITLAEIDRERNAELRRILIHKYGEEKFLSDSNATVLDDDPDYGILYRRDFRTGEPLFVVKVLNATAESDGTRRSYFLRVAPHVRTAREAVAWTFQLNGNQYNPDQES